MADQLRATRRQLVQGAAVVGISGPVLVACGGGDGMAGPDEEVTGVGTVIKCGCHGSKFSAADGSVINGPASDPLEAKSVTVEGGRLTVDGKDVAASADVPVGGAGIFPDQQVVISQPTEGTFNAFTAVCTHQRCIVSDVEES